MMHRLASFMVKFSLIFLSSLILRNLHSDTPSLVVPSLNPAFLASGPQLAHLRHQQGIHLRIEGSVLLPHSLLFKPSICSINTFGILFLSGQLSKLQCRLDPDLFPSESFINRIFVNCLLSLGTLSYLLDLVWSIFRLSIFI